MLVLVDPCPVDIMDDLGGNASMSMNTDTGSLIRALLYYTWNYTNI